MSGSFERGTEASSRIVVGATRRQGIHFGKNRIRCLMNAQGLQAVQKRCFRPQTTQSRHDEPLLPIGLKTSLKRHSVPIRFGLPTSLIFRARKKVGFIWPLKWICAPSDRGLEAGRFVARAAGCRSFQRAVRSWSAPALHHSDRGVRYGGPRLPPDA